MASTTRPWMWTTGTVQAFITGPGSAFVGVTTPRYHRDDPVVNDRGLELLERDRIETERCLSLRKFEGK